MELILLSGGSGKRLWPLSNDSRSKQFLKVLNNNEILESMVQRVWGQLQKVQLHQSTVIATSKSQADIIHSQLGDHVPLIIEPERRDTFPAIALASTFLFSIKGVRLDDVIVVLPVDPYVGIEYFEKIKRLESIVKETDAELVLMGVKPTYPSEKYGYIVPQATLNQQQDCLHVSHFKEKPTESEAQELINQDALWNCGVFAFRLEFMISLLKNKGFPTHYEELQEQYNQLDKTSFDYAVVEKAKKINVLSYTGDWKDLGTWNTLTEEMGIKQIGKGIISEDSTNTHLINELDIPVTVVGIKDAVVAASPDGILVTDKASSPRLKDVLNGFSQRPMFEERRWGWYKVLDYTKYDEHEVLTKRICILEGKNLSYQKHNARKEIWTIIKGSGLFAFNGEIHSVQSGDVLEIPLGSIHGIKASTDLEIIEVQSGSQLVEEDIERIFTSWDDVEQHCKIFRPRTGC
ncbi:sugar phosphate nucleotidyltransferase [Cohnella caldifontis]|uniref:sugar phosphate nucleotidyltransferase n=1 Tax=Cohnella caldifontis TaxID=3027471 RepID=UPI0023EC5697|nr:sugar phosphate nucleotidyltransferase [Cohnella sp. YIM B05605]